MKPFDSFFDANRRLWDTWTELHEQSPFYNLEGFRNGKLSLRPIEMEELAPHVRGKTLLHLMCHFGLDTLSWARLGAQVTGIDFSDESIRLARSLSHELGIPARFIRSNLYDLPELLDDRFDIVFTSYGVLHWLPDLTQWAKMIASFLRTGGIFYMVEDHPFMRVFASASSDELHVKNSYFYHEQPYALETQGSYASAGSDAPAARAYIWDHSLSEIFNSLRSAGLELEFFHEFNFAMRAKFPLMVQSEDGRWRLPDPIRDSVPLLFSLKARKPVTR